MKKNHSLPRFENVYLLPSEIGAIAHSYWNEIPEHFPFIELDNYQVMPDHIHGILIIRKKIGIRIVETQNLASLHDDPHLTYKNKFGPQSGNISSVIRGYKAGVKSFATKNKIDFLWQSRFYDHIIGDKGELFKIRKYIANNPKNWINDKNNEEGLYR